MYLPRGCPFAPETHAATTPLPQAVCLPPPPALFFSRHTSGVPLLTAHIAASPSQVDCLSEKLRQVIEEAEALSHLSAAQANDLEVLTNEVMRHHTR